MVIARVMIIVMGMFNAVFSTWCVAVTPMQIFYLPAVNRQ